MNSRKRLGKAPPVRYNGRRPRFFSRVGYAPVVSVWFFCALLLVAAFGCGSDDAVVPPQGETPAASVGVTLPPQGETPADNVDVTLPRHHEPPVINSGDQYVFGELFQSGSCLRVTYRDQVSPELTREGLLVVWPPGFSAVVQDDVAHVADSDGRILATTGDTVRLSGRKARHPVGEAPEWDWDGEPGAGCGGTHWLVGDEVSAGVSESSNADTDGEIFFPTLGHQRGPIVSMAALLEGRLELQGECLRVVTTWEPEGIVVVWPPGFGVEMRDGESVMVNGGGSVIAHTGDHVALGGGQAPGREFPVGSRCPGEAWHAMEVRRMP